ncbi:hypothetical protein ABZ901_34030 [Actinacidiphila alni]|uniref:hypothetical protein n=1 Tax=Actinacidiphila alni TaxID=380248 RepID=UPI0033F5A935
MKSRRQAYGKVATELSLKSDRALRALLERATPTASGIGGRTSRVRLAETTVLVKEIRLTDKERLARIGGPPDDDELGARASGRTSR